MNKARICLLLSKGRIYPRAEFDDEKWLLEAHNQLQQARLPPVDSSPAESKSMVSQWNILRACYSMRVRWEILGLRRAHLYPAMLVKMVPFQPSDLEEDTRFPWFLSVEVKRRLSEIFLALVDLSLITYPLCHILMGPKLYLGWLGEPRKLSIMGELEECEGLLAQWQTNHTQLLLTSSDPPKSDPSYYSLLAIFANLRLTYEYLTSTLHQISLCSERP
ncbi:hypothetical protein P152DRAFT_231105 [Eremomyces bilateralis CBS 781.70]|uniref:Transcription factor domain-containing protein n=1 Tax=Eremomyces bilateralis CBS 781.70 TaxID=1392243 RepID=A0A6G1G9H6_9PEZI|nr:uncharacterized protein P152DRAFT_231105 [Eremomyces bilateralis CBS 781.70]KAF1814738.1 hypothetical protein P152DRAFT_231105 [Eremomyces bilateralis CBS 781.70]